MDLKQLASQPLFFERNRVARVYIGGLLYHDFLGDKAEDSYKPEEWVCSSVRALNRRADDPKEGVSRVRGTDVYFDDLLAAEKSLMLGDRDSLGVLVKYIDSAIRLPLQAHPDKAFSRQYLHSEYGKAECWLVLATRPGAKIYFGFNHKMTKEEFIDAIEKSETDKKVMDTLLYGVDAHVGDVFFVPPKMVHGIGYGCMILEIQEPTDFTVQPERWCGDYKLNDQEMYIGLPRDIAVQCFDFDVWGADAVDKGRKTPVVTKEAPGLIEERLIGPEDTPCFGVNRFRLSGGHTGGLHAPAIYVVPDGEGTLSMEGYERTIKKGEYFFLPYSVDGKCTVSGTLTLVQCLPPQV